MHTYSSHLLSSARAAICILILSHLLSSARAAICILILSHLLSSARAAICILILSHLLSSARAAICILNVSPRPMMSTLASLKLVISATAMSFYRRVGFGAASPAKSCF